MSALAIADDEADALARSKARHPSSTPLNAQDEFCASDAHLTLVRPAGDRSACNPDDSESTHPERNTP